MKEIIELNALSPLDGRLDNSFNKVYFKRWLLFSFFQQFVSLYLFFFCAWFEKVCKSGIRIGEIFLRTCFDKGCRNTSINHTLTIFVCFHGFPMFDHETVFLFLFLFYLKTKLNLKLLSQQVSRVRGDRVLYRVM
jgi:hypothetical protein